MSLVRRMRWLCGVLSALSNDKTHSWIRYPERWFYINLNNLKSCSCCIGRDKERALEEPYFSATNKLNFVQVPGNLPNLAKVEETLIDRVHVHVEVL